MRGAGGNLLTDGMNWVRGTQNWTNKLGKRCEFATGNLPEEV